MDTAFFGTKFFAISAVVAALLVGGAIGAYYVGGFDRSFSIRDACDAPALSGTTISATPVTQVEDDGRRRVETYTLNASAYQGGALDLCLEVGEILVEPSAGDDVSLEVVTTGNAARAVEATTTEARFSADGDRLVVGVWESARGELRTWFGGDGATVRAVLKVPSSGAYQVQATNDVGDVRLSGLMIEDASFATDVGMVVVREVDVIGNVTLASDVGDTILHAASVTTGKIDVSSDVGNAEANLPQRADVGYDATASTDVGEAYLSIGDVENSQSEDEGPGGRHSARTSGFATKPTRVVVDVSSDVGDARIVAS